jgi:transposase-like protein
MTERRQFNAEFKTQIVLELITGKKGLMEASREYQIKDSVISRWRQEFLERAPQVFERGEKEVDPKDAEIAELERALGRTTMQLEIAKKVLGHSNFLQKESEK